MGEDTTRNMWSSFPEITNCVKLHLVGNKSKEYTYDARAAERQTGDILCSPTVLEHISCTPRRWPFKIGNIFDLYVLLAVHPCIISWISPTRCTILLNIFIFSLLYMFRASTCPTSRENYCIYATLLFVTLYGWRLFATHTEWQILVSHTYSNFLLVMGTWVPATCREDK